MDRNGLPVSTVSTARKRARTEPNWDALALMVSPEARAARRAEITRQTAAANSRRMRAESDAACIVAAGGDPATARGKDRRSLIAAGRAIKAKARAAKQAPVKALHARRIRSAMPAWADPEAIKAVYVEAARLTAETGIPHEVDHTIPLLGENVSGLHVAENLRAIPRLDNRRKGNRL
jgi:hypothetical protein